MSKHRDLRYGQECQIWGQVRRLGMVMTSWLVKTRVVTGTIGVQISLSLRMVMLQVKPWVIEVRIVK